MELDIYYTLTNRSGEMAWGDVLQATRRHSEMADELGYDRIWLGEHHFDVGGTDACPNPVLLAADLAARTKRVRIGMAAVSLTLWHPVRVAEDLAMVDHFSDGRLDVAFGRGILPIEVLTLNPDADRWNGPDTSREIFDENFEIVTGLWTEDAFSYEGKRFKLPVPGTKYFATPGQDPPAGWTTEDGELVALGLMPRPFQRPTPPLFSVTESESGFVGAARKGISAITWYPTGDVLRGLFEAYRDAVAEVTGTAPPLGENLGVLRLCLIADSDDEARRIAEPSIVDFFNLVNEVRSIGVWLDADEDPDDPCFAAMDPWDLLMERDHLMVGSPESVLERMTRLSESHGIQNWLLQMGIPGIDDAQIERSIELFAGGVMPGLRQVGASTTAK